MSDIIEPIAPREPTPETAPATELTNQATDLSMMKLEGFFGVQNPNTQDSKALSEISRMIGVRDDVDMLWEIKHIENRIGTPPIGMTRLQHVYNFISINSQIQGLEKERDLYVG